MRTLLLALLLSLPVLAQQPCQQGATARLTFTVSTATGNQEIIPLTAGRQIVICAFIFNADAAGVVKITSGTGTNCGTGTADVLLIGSNITGAGWALDDPAIYLAIGAAACLNFSATVSATGTVFYQLR